MLLTTPTPTLRHRASISPFERETAHSGSRSRSLLADSASHRLDRLDIQAALILHLEWCVLFHEHMSTHATANIVVPELSDVERSGLGQWIERSRSQAAGQHPLFAELDLEHHQLHAVAYEALCLAQENRMDLATTLLNNDFECSRARVLALLRSMQSS